MRTYNLGWVFMLIAVLILIFGCGVSWWASILIVLLANVEVTFSN